MPDPDFYFDEDSRSDSVPQSFAAGPKTGFVENFRASYRATIAAGRTDSREVTLRDAYDNVTDALNADFRKAEGFTLVSPDAAKMFRNPYRGRSLNPAFDAAGGVPVEEQRIWGAIAERRKRDPNFLKDLGADRNDFVARLNQRSRQALERESATREQATTGGSIGGFIGSMAGGFSDPVNLGSMVIGAGPARSILQTALREAAINAGVEAASTPAIASRRKEIGAPFTLSDAVESIATAGAVGAVVGGGVELGWRGYGKLRDGRPIAALSERELIDEIGRLGDVPAEVATARDVLSAKVEVDELNPGNGPEHMERLQEATERLTSDELPAPRSLTPEERLAAFAEPAGEGQRRQIEQLTHDIRAAKLEQEIGELPEEVSAALPAPAKRRLAPPTAISSGGGSAPTGTAAVSETVRRITQVESSGNATARNPNSSATGLGQFISSTWLSLYKKNFGAEGLTDAQILAKRTDPKLSLRMTEIYVQDNAAALSRRGHDVTPGTLYLSHFLGSGGADKLLSASRATPVAQLLKSNVIAANRSILAGKTAGNVIDWASRKMGQKVQRKPITVALREEVIDGEALPIVRPLDDVLAEHDADDAFISAVEACL